MNEPEMSPGVAASEGKSPDDEFFALVGESPCFAIIHRGSLAFRFGPYRAAELGAIMNQSLADDTPVSFVIDCGAAPFNHQLARDLRGYADPAELAAREAELAAGE